jgi:hypothetical protein
MKKKINVTLDPGLHAKVKSVAPLRGLNVEKAYDAALRTWLDEPPPPVPEPAAPPYEAANMPLHDKLERILNSGDAGTIRAVVPNIEIFHERLKPIRGGRRANEQQPIPLAPEEARIIEEFRKSSYTKRQQMLGFAAKPEESGPEVMPQRKRASGK